MILAGLRSEYSETQSLGLSRQLKLYLILSGRISNFELIFGFEIRISKSRRVASSQRFEKFDFVPTHRIRDSRKFEDSTALVVRIQN